MVQILNQLSPMFEKEERCGVLTGIKTKNLDSYNLTELADLMTIAANVVNIFPEKTPACTII